jgi:hypothetical protein
LLNGSPFLPIVNWNGMQLILAQVLLANIDHMLLLLLDFQGMGRRTAKRIVWMKVDLEQLQRWANDPEQAGHHLEELIAAVGSDEEEVVSWSSESLENCGPPPKVKWGWIAERLSEESGDRQYWLCTLAGRIEEPEEAMERALVKVASGVQVAEANAVRACWALERFPRLAESSRLAIQQLADASPSPGLRQAAAKCCSRGG